MHTKILLTLVMGVACWGQAQGPTNYEVEYRLRVAERDRWWRNAEMAKRVGLEPGQQQKMDEIFQQYRLQLIDLNAALQKAELALEPLMNATTIDERRIAAQIDTIAAARAELEKAKGRMLLEIRMQMTLPQWDRLNQASR